MFEFNRGNYEQKSRQILEATRGLSSTDLEGTHLIECLRSHLKVVTEEMERLRSERDEAIALIENIAKEVNVLSTRPAAIIKFSDLVDQINEWGDTARNILDKKANSNV